MMVAIPVGVLTLEPVAAMYCIEIQPTRAPLLTRSQVCPFASTVSPSEVTTVPLANVARMVAEVEGV